MHLVAVVRIILRKRATNLYHKYWAMECNCHLVGPLITAQSYVCTQHLPSISPVHPASFPSSLAALLLQGRLANFGSRFMTGCELKDRIKIRLILKRDIVMQHKHHTNISGYNIFN